MRRKKSPHYIFLVAFVISLGSSFPMEEGSTSRAGDDARSDLMDPIEAANEAASNDVGKAGAACAVGLSGDDDTLEVDHSNSKPSTSGEASNGTVAESQAENETWNSYLLLDETDPRVEVFHTTSAQEMIRFVKESKKKYFLVGYLPADKGREGVAVFSVTVYKTGIPVSRTCQAQGRSYPPLYNENNASSASVAASKPVEHGHVTVVAEPVLASPQREEKTEPIPLSKEEAMDRANSLFEEAQKNLIELEELCKKEDLKTETLPSALKKSEFQKELIALSEKYKKSLAAYEKTHSATIHDQETKTSLFTEMIHIRNCILQLRIAKIQEETASDNTDVIMPVQLGSKGGADGIKKIENDPCFVENQEKLKAIKRQYINSYNELIKEHQKALQFYEDGLQAAREGKTRAAFHCYGIAEAFEARANVLAKAIEADTDQNFLLARDYESVACEYEEAIRGCERSWDAFQRQEIEKEALNRTAISINWILGYTHRQLIESSKNYNAQRAKEYEKIYKKCQAALNLLKPFLQEDSFVTQEASEAMTEK